MKPSDLDKELEIYYIDENTGKEYTFTEYLDSVIDSLEKTIQEENRTKYPTSKDDSDNFFKFSRRNSTPYERTKAEIYNRGNKWQIENWESTHN